MKFANALVVGFAAATSAFLIPPNVPEHFKDLRFKGGPPQHVKDFIHALLEGKTTEIDLDCPNCGWPTAREDIDALLWEPNYDAETAIHLEFATKEGVLTLNGQPLLPIEEAQKAQTTSIKAHQIRKDNGKPSADFPLNFALEVMPAMPSPHKDDVSLIPIELTVLGMNGIPVKVNTISLKLIQTPHKELVIVNHEEIPFAETPGAEACQGARAWSMCRLRAIVLARIQSLIETTKDKADNVQGWVKTKCGGGRQHHGHPHGPHHGHHGPHRYHRVGHMLHQTFRFFVIPALLGVIGGLAASAIGMLVGQAIVFLWFRSYRRGQRGPLRLSETEVIIVPEEKDELLAEEGLPEYEDAPRYETVIQGEIENEKQ